MKTLKNTLLWIIAIVVIISLIPTVNVIPLVQKTLGIIDDEVALGGVILKIPDDWGLHLSSGDESTKKYYGVLPYKLFKGIMLDKEVIGNHLISYMAPNNGDYFYIHILRMTKRDRMLVVAIEKKLAGKKEDTVNFSNTIEISRCKLGRWNCYQSDSLKDKAGDSLSIIDLPELNLQIFVSRDFVQEFLTSIEIQKKQGVGDN